MPPKGTKGAKSKTMEGEEDFTTKETSKEFDRGGKREKKAEGSKKDSKPFAEDKEKAVGKKKMRKMSESEKALVKKVIEKKALGKSEQAKLRMAVMRSEGELDMRKIMKLVK